MTRMDSGNRFALGLFGFNCSGGLAMTKAPERWDASWDNNVMAAKLAEAAGLEFVLPIARWHGYRGETDSEGTSFETLSWASGLLDATRELAVFGTVHVSLINPVFAAKQAVTASHIGKGRFGLNVVSGWNEGEYDMFGVKLLDHDERYAYTEEWVAIVRRLWTDADPFDFTGRYFDLKGVIGKPKPYGDAHPLLMSAGSSRAGRVFATRHADCLFMSTLHVEKLAGEIAALRAMAGGRVVRFYTSGHIVSRPTQKEAEEYYRYVVHEMGDWEAAEHIIAIRVQGQSHPPEMLRQLVERLIGGVGTFPMVGSFDGVTAQMKQMSDAGLSGLAFGLVNYIDEFPFVRDELLPRLERLGLRQPAQRR
jgi:dimethylsulfone monooxygenase